MKHTYFENAGPVCTVSLQTLLDRYLAKHSIRSQGDRSMLLIAFDLLTQQFPDCDTGNFNDKHLLVFRNNIVLKTSKHGKTYDINYCNRLVGMILRVFYWAMNPNKDVLAIEDIQPAMVDSSVVFALSKVPKFRQGDGRMNPKRKDAQMESISALLAMLPPTIADMARLQLFTSLRPSEVCKMKVGDLVRTKEGFEEIGVSYIPSVWLYVMNEHKTARYVGKRMLPLGLHEQSILQKYLIGKLPTDPVFSKSGKQGFGTPYNVNRYGEFFKVYTDKHDLPRLTPYQLRHTSYTKNSKEFGRDIARAVAGHTTESMATVYDHSDLDKLIAMVQTRNEKQRANLGQSASTPGRERPAKTP